MANRCLCRASLDPAYDKEMSLLCVFHLTHDKALNTCWDTSKATHTYIYLLYSKLFLTPNTICATPC
jgi:hypothetical protein